MDHHDFQRRIFLGKALTVSCVLAVPILIQGCGESEEGPQSEEMKRNPSPEGTETFANKTPTTSNAQEGGKISKEKAKYQEQPKGNQQCANCEQFVAESNSCKLVSGQVSPQGWCTLWVEKA